MPFLKINGITVKVTNASPRLDVVRKGRRGRSYSGQMRDGRRGRRRTWSMKSPCLVHSEALALTNLIWGTSHVFHFYDGLQAASGLNPVPGYSGITWQPSAGLGGDDIGYIQIAGSASSPSLSYDAQINDEYTILWHERDGGDWIGAALNDVGTGYLNGSPNSFVGGASTDVQLSIAGGVVSFSNSNATAIDVDQIVILPWRATASQMATWTAISDDAVWGPGPALLMSGDMFTEDCVYGYGRVNEVKRIQFASINNGAEVSFEIDEVDETYLRGVFPDCVPVAPAPTLTGAWLEPMVLETTDLTIGNIADKGPGAPSSPITITGKPTTEWGCLVNRNPSGEVVWAHTFTAVGGLARSFLSSTATKAGQTYGLVCGWCEADSMNIQESDGTAITTLTRPAEYTVSSVNNPWGWAASFDLTTGALNWAQVGAFDDTCTQNAHRYRPQHLVFGGPTGDDLMMVVDIQTRENAASDVPNPTWGTGTVATFGPINSANIGAAALASQWIVQIDPTTGDPVSTTSHVANYNDDAANFGATVNRSSIGETVVNRSNLIWNPTTALWYLSANFSCEGDLGIVGTYIGKGKTGEFQTRNVVDFGGDNTVKAYVCTYDSTLEPQNAVTLAADTVSLGNSFYAYNHEVHLVPDGSGDVFWGFQNMANGTPINLERDGVLGNYGGGQYSVVDPSANNSVTVRLNTSLEVVWESSAFASAYSSVGKGHSVNMAPVPNDSTKMLAAVTTWNLNTAANNPTSLYGSANVSFDRKQTFVAAFDIATGAFVDEREMERAQNDDKMQILSMRTATSGPDNGITFALVVMSTDTNTTVQGFYDTAGVRQYNTADYWNSNSAVYTASVGGAVHLVAFDADGELLPGRCCPLSAIQDGNNLFNFWAGDISLY
jgi:hypothetical protein